MSSAPNGPRIHLGRIEDKYVLGIVCELFGLTGYATRSVPMLHDPARKGHKEAVRLFELGQKRARDDDNISYKSVAGDLWHVYNYSIRHLPKKPDKETSNQKALMALIRKKRDMAGEKIARDLVGWYRDNRKRIAAKDREAMFAIREALNQQVKERHEVK